MTKIPETFPMGDKDEITKEKLFEYLEDMYRILSRAINEKPSIITRKTAAGAGIDGQSDDSNLAVGDINVNETTDKVEMLTSFTDPRTVTWTQLSP